MATFIKSTGQVTGLVIFSLVINKLTEWTHLPLPGNIVGIVVLFALLHFRIVKLEWIDLGAKWLLAEMLLFFIPPVVGVIEYKELLLANGVQIVVVILLSLLTVMAVTGALAEKLSVFERKRSL